MAEELELNTESTPTRTAVGTAVEIYDAAMNKPREDALRVIHVALAIAEGMGWQRGWEAGSTERLQNG